MQIKKWQVVLAVAILIVLIIGTAWTLANKTAQTCTEKGMAGECLPEGKCIAPNDAIVSCKKLRENPNKTDWLGNE